MGCMNSTDLRRGDVWWAELDPTCGAEINKTRPVVIITTDSINRVRRTVAVVPLSTGPKPRPPIIVATSSAGSASVTACDQIRALDRSRLTRQSGTLSPKDLRSVEDGVRACLRL
jgi:mRNA interferase MazF